MPFVTRPVKSLSSTADDVLSSASVAHPESSPQQGERSPVVAAASQPAASVDPARKPKKTSKPKRQPTGDYPVGYCRAPAEHRFDGSRPGPGRPRGSQSQDTLLRKHLSKSRMVTIDGKRVKVQTRELGIMLRLKEALEEKKRHSLDYVLAHAHRLFPQAAPEHGGADPHPGPFDAADDAILAEAKAMLLGETGELA